MMDTQMNDKYKDFLAAKSQIANDGGFAPLWIHDGLFDFQKALVEWSLRKGRAAIFADCGLGKTPMQLVWAENVVRKTNKPVLILTPLAVAKQTEREGRKFSIDCFRSIDGTGFNGHKIIATNYERLHHFNPEDFAGVVCDESSILKNFDGATKDAITEFMRTREYRLLCTATAAPNDYTELGTSSECLGELGFMDMLNRFFKKAVSTMSRAQELRHGNWKFRGHAEHDFWRWVCSWARAIRKPSDIGFNDGRFILPKLITREHIIKATTSRPGFLFDLPAVSLAEQREERRRTINERCERAAELVSDTGKPAVVWTYLNDESAMISRMVPDAVEVKGSDETDAKEDALCAFADGEIRVLVTKPTIAGFGMNWQHCAHQVFFPSHSFEQWYQAIRRSWRFGQTQPVTVDVVASEGEAVVLKNLQRKAHAAEIMFDRLVEMMNDEMKIQKHNLFTESEVKPSWL